MLSTFCKIIVRWMSQNSINDKSTMVQVTAWCHQATSHYLSQCWPSFCHHMVSLGHNELKWKDIFISVFHICIKLQMWWNQTENAVYTRNSESCDKILTGCPIHKSKHISVMNKNDNLTRVQSSVHRVQTKAIVKKGSHNICCGDTVCNSNQMECWHSIDNNKFGMFDSWHQTMYIPERKIIANLNLSNKHQEIKNKNKKMLSLKNLHWWIFSALSVILLWFGCINAYHAQFPWLSEGD